MSRSRVRHRGVRKVAAVATMAAAAAFALPGAASAAPGTGSSTGSGIIDGGVGIVEGCIANVGGCLGGVINGGSSVLDLGSSILGLGLGSSQPNGPSGPIQQCNQSTQSGNDGVTNTTHRLGRSGPASFVLSYETYSVPDDIQVFYEGALVYDTGFVGDNNAPGQGTGSVMVNLPAGSASTVLVRVIGGIDTRWDYTVHCPS